MATYIALLRAVNVAGRNSIAMSDLKELLGRLGFAEPRTLLQSGNAVFQGAKRSTTALEKLLEAETERRLRVKTEYFVRTPEEWERIIAGNPFAESARDDPSHLLVMPLKAQPSAEGVRALREAITGSEVVEVVGPAAYLVYPDGIGRSRLTSSLIERKLGTSGTARNWNTVLKLRALVS